jgi:hypothetical protein
LDGSALQSIVARTHLHSDSFSVLHDLSETHQPLHIPEVIAAKTIQLGNTKRMANESVDAYYNHFKELFDKIQEADGNIPVKNAVRHFIFMFGSEFEPIQNNYHIDNLPLKLFDKIQEADGNIPVKNAVRHFIFMLGSEFEPIQNNYHIDNLPLKLFDKIQEADGNIPVKNAVRHFIFMLVSEFEPIQNNYHIDNLPLKWQTKDWLTILVLCHNFYHSFKPQGIQPSKNNFSAHNVNHLTHQKKVKEWFLHPAKYCKEIASEQRKCPNKYIYHL